MSNGGRISRGRAYSIGLAILSALFARTADAVLEASQAAALTSNLEALSATANTPLAADTTRILLSSDVTDTDWATFFTVYFRTHQFTQPLADFFAYAVAQLPGAAPRPAVIAATAAAAASASELAKIGDSGPPTDLGSLPYSLNMLQSASGVLPQEARGSIFSLMTSELKGRTLDLTALLQPGPEGNSSAAALGIQICLTLSAYAGQGSVLKTTVRLPDRMRAFLESTGVFLFDNGALNDAQTASLDSMIRSFPPVLHEVVALMAAEAYGLDPALPGLVAPGQIVAIPPVSMDVLTDPGEFILGIPSPVAPDFAATAAVNVFRAVQAVQFARRPYLALRRDAILARSGTRRVSYLRQGVSPELYMDDPSEFLPLAAYLWFINSEAAYRMGIDFFRLSQPAPAETLLLIADVLSNGSDTTLTFAISPDGIVASASTPLGRTLIEDVAVPAPDVPPVGVALLPNPQVNAITMFGRIWDFSLGPTGELRRLFHEGGSFSF